MPSREGNLDAPTRHPVDWRNPDFYNEESLFKEMERIFDICHGCRRCVSLCGAFPTLFDLVDNSKTMEVDGVAKHDFWKVVDQCYLCDLCFMTKCPYVPAASVERRFSEADATRESEGVRGRQAEVSGSNPHQHRPTRQARDDSGRRAGGEQSQHDTVGTARDGQSAGGSSRGGIAALRGTAFSRSPAPVVAVAGAKRSARPREGRAVRDLLYQLQRAWNRSRPAQDSGP
jgi:formate hydrogenlyase subunit 6/NADH:ubiquinone oxidoreductase subunit I